jgi:hypothetical protein
MARTRELPPFRTRRHRRKPSFGALSGSVGPPQPPTFNITSFSPGSGPIAGGTAVVVVATGIVGTPTSTLGAVSGVTGTGFTITTSSHAAGVVSWTATNGDGHVSAPQAFTYVAASQWDVNNFPNFPSQLSGGEFPIVYNIVLDGDSLTAGPNATPTPGPANWAPELQALLGSQMQVTTVAYGGKTLAQMVTDAPSTVDTLISTAPGVCNVVWWQGGINDAVAGATSAQIEARYQAYGTARKAAGWNLVIVGNVEASNAWTATAVYSTIAAWMQANASSFSDGMADFPANATIGPTGSYSNTIYYLDNVHKTINGDELKAREIIYPAFQALLVPSDQAAGHAVFGCYPNHGPIGTSTQVGVRVTNLLSTDTITSVVIGGQTCTALSFDYTLNTVFATVPAGSSSGDVVVTINGSAARGGTGLWTANNVPILTSVQPSVIVPGTACPLTITCDPAFATFSAGMVPSIDGTPCSSVVIVSPTKLTCTTPTGLTPTTRAGGINYVQVAGSPQSAASKVGIVPTSITTLIQTCAANYSVGSDLELLDVTHAFHLRATTGNATYVSGTSLNGRDGIQLSGASPQTMANNASPTAPALPFSHFAVLIAPPWITGFPNGYGGFAGSNNSGGLTQYGANLRMSGVGGGWIVPWSNTAGLPGNLLVGVINTGGATGAIYVDGSLVAGGSSVGTVTASGVGIAWGLQGGFYGACTLLLHGIANDALTAGEIDALHFISQEIYGTA